MQKGPTSAKGRETVVPPSFADLELAGCECHRTPTQEESALSIRNVDHPAGLLTNGSSPFAFSPALRGPFSASSPAGSHQPPAFCRTNTSLTFPHHRIIVYAYHHKLSWLQCQIHFSSNGKSVMISLALRNLIMWEKEQRYEKGDQRAMERLRYVHLT